MLDAMQILAALALAQADATRPAVPLPEAAYIVLSPFEVHGSNTGKLLDRTRQLLITMHDLDLLRYVPLPAEGLNLRECLSGDSEPSAARRACLRSRLPARQQGVPVVAIVIGYTGERGAWQRMECIGPTSEGLARNVYVDQGFHQNVSWRRGIRAKVRACIADALGTLPQN